MTLDTGSFSDAVSWERQEVTDTDEGLGYLPTMPFVAAIPWDQLQLQLFTWFKGERESFQK